MGPGGWRRTEGREAQSRPPWELTDLISVDTLRSIQDTSRERSGLPTVILDSEGRDATTITHRVTFCEDLTSTSPVGGALQGARPVRNAGGRRRVAPRHLQGCR
jgi:hypothetical protein